MLIQPESPLLAQVALEMARAQERFGPFTSAHEGYGVLAEEVAELLEAIRTNNAAAITAEAIQVAAVAARIAESLEDMDCWRRSGCWSSEPVG